MRLVLPLVAAVAWMMEGDLLEQHSGTEREKRERQAHRRTKILLLYSMASLNGKRLTLRDFLDAEGRLRRDRRIPRCALLEPADSPWEKLYTSGNDQALITVTGFDHSAFAELLKVFAPYFNRYTPWTGKNDGSTYRRVNANVSRKGRPRKVNTASCLGMTLAWFRFKGAEFILQGWFGFTGTPANVWLRFTRRMLLMGLFKHPEARVKMPDDCKIRQYQKIIEDKHPSLAHVFCVADGLKLSFEATHGLSEQSMYYNGWQHGHYVTNLLVFGPDGKIISAVVNAPGSIHDSTLADWGDIYEQLETIYNRCGGICCLDSAFASQDADYLIRSSEDLSRAQSAEEVIQLKEATSLRQAAEWGMRAIQSAFPRLKDKIQYEEGGERKVFLMLAVLLYNIRIELVGLNQIRNVYVPEWSKDSRYLMHNY